MSATNGRKRYLSGRDLDYLQKKSVGHPHPYNTQNNRSESSYKSQLKAKLSDDLIPYYLDHLDDWNIIARALSFDQNMGQGLKESLQKDIEENLQPIGEFLKNWLTEKAFVELFYRVLIEDRKQYSGQRYFQPSQVLTAIFAYIESLNLSFINSDLEAERKEIVKSLEAIISYLNDRKLEVIPSSGLALGHSCQNIILGDPDESNLAWILKPKGLIQTHIENGMTIDFENDQHFPIVWGFEINVPALILESLTKMKVDPRSLITTIQEKENDASVLDVEVYLATQIALRPICIINQESYIASRSVDLGVIQRLVRKDSPHVSFLDSKFIEKVNSEEYRPPSLYVDPEAWYQHLDSVVKGDIFANIFGLELSDEAVMALKEIPLPLEGQKVVSILYPSSTMKWIKNDMDSIANRSGGLVNSIKMALNQMEKRGLITITGRRNRVNKPSIRITEKGLNCISDILKLKKLSISVNTFWQISDTIE